MLEVRKSLFSASYTADELEKFEVNSTIAEEDKTYMAARTEISALATVSTLPDYVLVEAEEGHVVECYGSAAFGAVGSIEVGEAREEELKDDQPGMKPVSEWKLRKPKQRRKRGEYILWENGDLIGKGADGSIIIRDEGGLCVIAMNSCEWLSDYVMQEIEQAARREDTTKDTENTF
ncbi:unnamed protein product [Alternaria alternata]